MLRDVLECHAISQPLVLRWLVCQLLGSAAGTFSINKFHIDLKSQGIAVGKNILHSYLIHLDGHEELVQVCAGVDHPETFVREIRALQDAASTWPQAALQLITLNPLISGTLPTGMELCLAGDWLLSSGGAAHLR